jgi:hypothetical protein
MALANYADLLASVANWAHRTDLTAILPDCVALAEARIQRDILLRTQTVTSTLTTTAGVQSVALPADWLEFENVSVATTPEKQLSYVTIEQLDTNYPFGASTGIPSVYTIEGSNILFGQTPDTAYTINIIYYAKFPSLITSSTNWLLTNHPSIYLNAVLVEVMSYIRDNENLSLFNQRYADAIAQLDKQNDRAIHSGSVLRVRVS